MFNKPVSFQKTNLLLLVVYSLPVLLLFWFITTFSVNVPFWDDWELVKFFEKIDSGIANFSDFTVQHNEHRIFFPRIIFAILAFSSKWNLKLETYLNFLLALVNFLLIYKIAANNSLPENKKLFNLVNITICILNFSLIQYENWLWGFQIAWLLINTCLILAVFIIHVPKNLPPNLRILLASICCFIASFSSAHGLLSWLALLPSIYSIPGSNKNKKITISVWLLLFIAALALYSIGYQKPANHPSIIFILQQPLIAAEYFFTLIGYSFGKRILPPVFTGLIILFAFLFVNIYCFKNYKSDFGYKAAPWLSLGWFAIMFASMTTVGRSGFGVVQATSPRYTTVLILLIISCLQLWPLWILSKWQDSNKNTYLFSGIRLCFGFLMAILIFVSTNSIAEGKIVFTDRNSAKTCLEIINFIEPSNSNSSNNCFSLIYYNELHLRKLTKTLQKLEFRDFPQSIPFITKADQAHGYIDIPPTTEKPLNKSRSDTLKLSGWAIIPEAQEQPPIVLFSYGNNQSFFATGLVNLNRPDVAKALNSSLYNTSGWEANVSVKSIPPGETVIKAWVYDRKRQQFIQLIHEPKIKLVD